MKFVFAKVMMKLGLFVFAVLQLCVLILIIVGTASPQFKHKAPKNDPTECLTMWKYYYPCKDPTIKLTTKDLYKNYCKGRANKFQAAEAFAIISIIVYFVTFICALIHIFKSASFRVATIILSFIGAITLLITWAIMAGLYNNGDTLRSDVHANSFICISFKKSDFKYDYGFILLVVGWVVAVLSMLLLFIKVESCN